MRGSRCRVVVPAAAAVAGRVGGLGLVRGGGGVVGGSFAIGSGGRAGCSIRGGSSRWSGWRGCWWCRCREGRRARRRGGRVKGERSSEGLSTAAVVILVGCLSLMCFRKRNVLGWMDYVGFGGGKNMCNG